jgi:hypothetical protein
MQCKSAEDIIDQILERDPNQFDARLIKDEWETWPHLLQCPPCSQNAQIVSPALKGAAGRGSAVLVRDGIDLEVALIQDVSGLIFKRELTPDLRCKWEFVRTDTPHGRIVAHYCFVEDAPKCSYLQESILQTGRPAKANGTAGYWLLQRLARQSSALFVLTKGNRVVYSNRFIFPENTRTTLRAIAKVIADEPKPCRTSDDIRVATQWHADHLDDGSIVF